MGVIDLHEFDVSAVLAELKRFSKLHPDVDPPPRVAGTRTRKRGLESFAGRLLDALGPDSPELLVRMRQAGEVLSEAGVPVRTLGMSGRFFEWVAAHSRAEGSARPEAFTVAVLTLILGMDEIERDFRNAFAVDTLARELGLVKGFPLPVRLDVPTALGVLRTAGAISSEHPEVTNTEVMAAAGLDALMVFVEQTPGFADLPTPWLYDSAVCVLDEMCAKRPARTTAVVRAQVLGRTRRQR